MALSYSNRCNFNDELEEKIKQFLAAGLTDENFQTAEKVHEVISWYKESNESKEEDSSDNVIIDHFVNEALKKLTEYVAPYYEDTIIKEVGIKTRFRDGTVETNFTIGLVPINPFIEFDKVVDKKTVSSVKFQFRLDTVTYMEGLSIRNKQQHRSIDIKKLGMSLTFYLESVKAAGFSFDRSIKLKEMDLSISDVSFYF